VTAKSDTGVGLAPENPGELLEQLVTSKRDGNLWTSIETSREAERIEVPDAQLQVAMNLIPAYTWYAAPSGGLTFVNERCADFFGLPKDHPLRFGAGTCAAWESQIPVLHPDDQEETRKVWSECLSASRYCEVSFRVRDAHGNYRWCLSRMEPLRGNDGTLLHWVGINIDIEERQQGLAKALRQTEERLQRENVAL